MRSWGLGGLEPHVLSRDCLVLASNVCGRGSLRRLRQQRVGMYWKLRLIRPPHVSVSRGSHGSGTEVHRCPSLES